MTEGSSKGLLPQLTDVLHALADSQELLLCKLRSVRLEREVAVGWDVDLEEPHPEFLEVVDQRPSAVVEPLPATASLVRKVTPVLEIEGTDAVNAHGAGLVVTAPGRAPLARDDAPPEEMEDVHTPASAPPQGVHSVLGAQPSDTDSLRAEDEAANRNYNYFDDLDARLAHLGDDEPADGNTESPGLLTPHERP